MLFLTMPQFSNAVFSNKPFSSFVFLEGRRGFLLAGVEGQPISCSTPLIYQTNFHPIFQRPPLGIVFHCFQEIRLRKVFNELFVFKSVLAFVGSFFFFFFFFLFEYLTVDSSRCFLFGIPILRTHYKPAEKIKFKTPLTKTKIFFSHPKN